MKKEICASLLLILLIFGAWLNIRHIDRLTDAIAADLSLSQAATQRGDFEAALAALREGLDTWLAERQYTGVFLSHRDLDSVYDTFRELEELLLQADAETAPAVYDKLRYYLEEIVSLERPRLSSIL